MAFCGHTGSNTVGTDILLPAPIRVERAARTTIHACAPGSPAAKIAASPISTWTRSARRSSTAALLAAQGLPVIGGADAAPMRRSTRTRALPLDQFHASGYVGRGVVTATYAARASLA